jgi:hypothetical protein
VDLLKPSYASGYAKNASQSAHPNLWDGLVGAWMPSLGVTGETLRDVSGNGNHGTLTGMDAASDWVATSKGLALDFDGVDDSCFIPSSDDLALTTLTISIWLKKETLNTLQYFLTKTQNKTYELSSHTNNGVRYRINNGVTTVFNVPSLLNDSEWHNVTVAHNGNDVVFYFDGKQNTTGNGTIINSTSGIMIGANISAGSDVAVAQFWSGNIGQISIYNRALSPSEIKHLYVDSLAPFRRKQRVSVAVPAAVAPSATYHPLRSLAHPLEQ